MAKFKHVGKTLTAMKAANKGGLVENLILSKLEAANILHLKQEYVDDDGKPVEPSVTEYLEREAVGIKNTLIRDISRPTTFKIRYMVDNQKMFRVSRLKEHFITEEIEEKLINEIRLKAPKFNGIIISDFNYGVII